MNLSYKNIELLINEASSLILAVRRKELMLEIGYLYIHFFFKIDDEEEYDDDFPDIDKINLSSWINSHELTDISISREAPVYEDDYTGKEAFYSMLAIFLRHFNSEFENAVKDWKVGYFEYKDNYIEPNPMVYGFVVTIRNIFWDNNLLYEWLISESNKSYPIEEINEEITFQLDNSQYSLFIAPNNLKIRRLGYIKLILSLFNDKDLIPESKLLREINANATLYESYLKQYKNTTGLILASKTGSSLKPYTELALRLQLLSKNLQMFQIGKTSRAYLQSLHIEGNVFELNLADKAFFLEALLSYDYLYIFTILYYVFTHVGCTYEKLKKGFQKSVLEYLHNVIGGGENIPLDKKLKILNVIGRIKNWQRTEVYLDHILIPRLNWLYDLDIINLTNDFSFSLTVAGKRLIIWMTVLQDINHKQTTNIQNGLNASMMRIVDSIYDLQYVIYDSKASSYLDSLIEKSFSLFKTLIRNRVTFSVLLTYVKLQMMEEYNIIIDANDIVGYIKNNNKYILKFQRSYGDGYLQKR
jgi:hypothetical protein